MNTAEISGICSMQKLGGNASAGESMWHCTENAWLWNYALGQLKQSRPLLCPGEEATVPQRDGDWELGLILSSGCADFCNQLVINKQQTQTQISLK